MSENRRRGRLARRACGVLASIVTTASLLVLTNTAAHADNSCTVQAGGGSSEGVAAIYYACVEVAKATPYVWGGGHGANPGPTGGGLDCSGLVRWAYAQATGGDPLGPGSTSSDWAALSGRPGVRVIPGSAGTGALLPGDLLYWSSDNTAGNIHHVAIYLGNNEVAMEPDTGGHAEVSPFFSVTGTEYYGALRLYGDTYSAGTGAKLDGGIDDVSGDGNADLVWSDGKNVNYLGDNSSVNPGHAFFYGNSAPVVQGLPANALVAAGSVLGHDTADLFIYDPAKDQVRLYPGAGGGTPYSGIGYLVATGLGKGVDKIYAADLTGDGFDELIWTKTDGTAWYLPNNLGSHADRLPFTGESGIDIANALPSDATIAFGDFSADNYADMLFVSGGNLYYLPNNIQSAGGGKQPFIPEKATQLTTDGSYGDVTQMTGANLENGGNAGLLWTDNGGDIHYLRDTDPSGTLFTDDSTVVAHFGAGDILI
jgi:hypothetical protein